MQWSPPGRKTPVHWKVWSGLASLAQVFSQFAKQNHTIGHVSPHLGSVQLRKIAFETILPHWASYCKSKGVDISLDIEQDVILKSKVGIVLHPPADPDHLERDLVWESFSKPPKTAGGPRQFVGGVCEVHMEVQDHVFDRIKRAQEDQQEEELWAAGRGSAKKANNKAKFRSVSCYPSLRIYSTHVIC